MNKFIPTIIVLFSSLILFNNYAEADVNVESQIKIYKAQNLFEQSSYLVLNKDNYGGAHIAVGDIDGDNIEEIIVGSGVGDIPEVKIYNGNGRYIGKRFQPFHPEFRGGITVAAGDVNGDGKDELIFGQASLGESRVKIYQANGKIIKEFLAYAPGLECGVNLSTGDINNSGKDEIITGAGRKGGPHVRIFDGQGNPTQYNYFPFHPNFRGGISVDIGDVNGDGIREIITSQAGDGEAWVKIYKKNGEVMAYDRLYPPNIESGVKVRFADIDNDGRDEIITATGYNGGPEVKYFEYGKGKINYSGKRVMAFNGASRQGVNVALGNINTDNNMELVVAPGNPKPIDYTDVNLNVPLYRQERNLSCEAASLRMALGYKGINISEEELINLVGYDNTPKNGGIWGDPQYGFVGSITGRQIGSGYGVYWRPIEKAASMFRHAYYFEGIELGDMLEEVSDGNPVIMWGGKNNDYRPVFWNTVFGRQIFALIGEHARVVRGFIGHIDNPSHIITNDPIDGERTFTKNEFIENWKYFNNSGVVVK